MLRQCMQTTQIEVSGQDERREMSFEIGMSRNQEVQRQRTNSLDQKDVFSPMPPLVSTMVTGRDAENLADDPFEMATWDVSRAQLYGEARRWIYTCLPEGHLQVGKLARLCRSMYGTRDAASILERHMVRRVEREFHEGRSRVPCFRLYPRWRTERFVPW